MKDQTLYIGPEQIMEDWHVARSTAYAIIRKMNQEIIRKYPTALIVKGKINKQWYEKACLKNQDM